MSTALCCATQLMHGMANINPQVHVRREKKKKTASFRITLRNANKLVKYFYGDHVKIKAASSLRN